MEAQKSLVLAAACLSVCLLACLFAAAPARCEDSPNASVTVQTTAPPNGVLRVQTTLDKKFVSKVYTLQQAKAAEIKQLLADAVSTEDGAVSVVSIKGAELLVVTVPSYMIQGLDNTVAALDKADASAAADGLESVYYRPKYRLPTELADLSKGACASGQATIVADDTNNVIFVSDSPLCLKNIIEAFQQFDIPEAQVEIEVLIAEVTEGDGQRIGLLWDAWKNALPESANFSYTRQHGGDFSRQRTLDFSNISPQALADFINYMAQKGAARIETKTVLSCLQRNLATVTAGDVYRVSPAATPREEGPAKKLVTTIVDGLVLELTPTIATDSIRLQIRANVSSLSGFGADGVPVVNSREVITTALLRDGQQFALSGLDRQTQASRRDRVWLLGHIPLLGNWLFTTESHVKQRSELIVCLKPRLLKHGDEGVRDLNVPAVKAVEKSADKLLKQQHNP